jgi:hypothetical protein
MKDFKSMRASSWGALWKGKWLYRALAVCLVLWAVSAGVDAVQHVLLTARDFGAASYEPVYFTLSTALFCLFIECLADGILTFGFISVMMSASGCGDGKWFSCALRGFSMPFPVMWLYFRMCMQIMLWTMLLIVPGVMAAYRYRQVWFLKVDHPDWSAGKCIAESCQLMKGRKWQLFRFDCSYWLSITAALAAFLVFALLVSAKIASSSDGRAALSAMAVLPVVVAVWFVVNAHFWLGQAFYYKEIKNGIKTESAPPSGEGVAAG